MLLALSASCKAERDIAIDNQGTEIEIDSVAWINLVEIGADIDFYADGRWQSVNFPATRIASQYLFNWQDLTIRVRSVAKFGKFSLQTGCNPPEPLFQKWIGFAQALADEVNTGKNTEARLSRLIHLVQTAPTDFEKARSTQLLANYYLNQLRFTEGETFFLRSAEHYLHEKKPAFAGVSLIGAAESADQGNRAADAIQHTLKGLSYLRTSAFRYFEIRASERLCLDQNRGDVSRLLACTSASLDSYEELGETLDSLASALDVAQFQRTSASIVNLDRAIRAYTNLSNTPDNYIHKGRFWLFNSLLARDRGDLASAFNFSQLSLPYFTDAKTNSDRWLANTYGQIADLYVQLGLPEQSNLVLMQGLSKVEPKHNPLRAASIFQRLGEQYASQSQTVESDKWFSLSNDIRQLMGAELERKGAAIIRAEVLIDYLAHLTLFKAISSISDIPAAGMDRFSIVKARLLLRLNHVNEAAALIKSVSQSQKSLLTGNYLTLARSELLAAQRESKEAYLILGTRLYFLAQTADQSPTAALAYLTLRSGEKVRRAWVDSLTPSDEPASVFRTALLATPARFMTSVTTVQKRVETVAKQAAGEVGFLAQLTGPQAVAPERFKAVNVPELAAFQTRLQKGGLALLLLPGDRQSAALWVSQDRAWVALLPARAELMAQVLSLSRALASPQSAPKTAQDAARVLASTLFSGMPNQAAPSSLWIVADELSAAIPFSTLQWPGSAEPLVAGTDISLITGLRVDPAQLGQPMPAARPAISAFFAPAYSNAGAAANPAGLQNLEFAAIERARIERESGKNWQAVMGKDATRAAFQDLIQTPGLMLHVAAHGRADPGVLGNAGLWLANNAGPAADFLSWLELGNMRTQAELLVLNACQSATGAQPSRQANISFALAMSASGANHVVAALWPVSDVASGTWIPAFYKQLTIGQTAGDLGGAHSAAALRQAQLSLYHSPHYRHPFYWASLVHFRRVVF